MTGSVRAYEGASLRDCVDQSSFAKQVDCSACCRSGYAPLAVHVALGRDAIVGLESAGFDVVFDVVGDLDVDRYGSVGAYRSLAHERQTTKGATSAYRQLRADR